VRILSTINWWASGDGMASHSAFPRALTSFVGRAAEIDRLRELLGRHRLVTVTGPGGVGKTRVVAELADRTGMHISLVELAAVQDPDQVPGTVADRLGCRQWPGQSVVTSIIALLASDPRLLVLDNCEQVVGAVAVLCSELLSASDDVRILATSREPLGVAGEARLRLRPLATQPPDTPHHAPSPGVALFADRARLADPAFRLTADSAPVVARIVDRVDGLPLAIELAAARCESLGLAPLLHRLDEPLAVLTSGSRTAPPRQRSLRATVEWSYELLDATEQQVLRRVSVFPGPFALAAAEAVADAQAAVPRLVDCSLLVPPADFPDGTPRYLMLDSVRAFAREQLGEAAEWHGAMTALVSYATSAASDAATGIGTAGREAAAARWFDIEHVLLSRALSWAQERDRDAALRLAIAMAGWWQLRGRAPSGYPLLRSIVAEHADRDDGWFSAHIWLGRLAHSSADWPAALHHFDLVHDGLASRPPTPRLVDGLTGRSGTLRNMGRLAEANAAAEAALELAGRLDYPEGRAQALIQLSLAASYADDQEAATRWAAEAARIDAAGLPDRVRRRVAIALTIVQTDSGQLRDARRTCADGLESARQAGDVDMQADFLYFTTHIALRAEQFELAGAPIRESLELTAQSGDRLRLLGCLDDCARLCAGTGRWAQALTLWAAHAAHQAALGMPEVPQDASARAEPLRHARARLGRDDARAAERRGRLMSLDAAAQFAGLLASPEPDALEAAIPVRLSPRERELLTLVARGRTDAQIAEDLVISVRTVRSHLDRIRDKTGSRRRADLTRLALGLGLI
jgi:non-specific serine/threonine protein kinase